MPEVTLEDMEEAGKATETKTTTSLKDIKLDDSTVPEAFRGKTAAELVEMAERLKESLRISEDARTSLSAAASRVSDPREERREAPADPADTITREDLEQMFKDEPMKAMEIYERRLVKNLGSHLDSRFGPLVSQSVSRAEGNAKDKYKIEFELFAKEIGEVAKQVNADVLSTDKGWQDIISYVRGQEGNFEKIMARRVGRSAEEARSTERESTGFSATATPSREATVVDNQGLDDVQRKIAENQFPGLSPTKAYAEYKKWM